MGMRMKYPGNIKKESIPTPFRQLVYATDRVFGDDPLDEINNQFGENDEEFQRSEKMIEAIDAGYKKRHKKVPSQKQLHLKPYLGYVREKEAWFFIKLWRNSTIRLLIWRLLLFNAIATGWFLLFNFRPEALTIVPNVNSMYDVLIFLTSVLFGFYIDRVLDGSNAPKKAYLNVLKVNYNLASAVTSMIRGYANRVEGEAVTLDRHDRKWTALDSLVHLQYLLHAMPYAILYEVRNKLKYSTLPLFEMQVAILNAENGINIARLDVIHDQIRQTLFDLESQGVLIKAQDSRILLPLVDEMSKSLTALQETVDNSIPVKYTNILNQTVFVFSAILPPIIYDDDKWGWAYFFYNVILYILYGFFRQSQEIRNPLEDKVELKSARAPIENWAAINCATIDQTFERTIQHIRKLNPEMSSHFHFNDDGSVNPDQKKKVLPPSSAEINSMALAYANGNYDDEPDTSSKIVY